MLVNDYRKIANFVKDNDLTIKHYTIKGTGGGFDDEEGYEFFKGHYSLGVAIVCQAFSKKEFEPEKTLKELESSLDNLRTVNVCDEDSLLHYLVNNHIK